MIDYEKLGDAIAEVAVELMGDNPDRFWEDKEWKREHLVPIKIKEYSGYGICSLDYDISEMFWYNNFEQTDGDMEWEEDENLDLDGLKREICTHLDGSTAVALTQEKGTVGIVFDWSR